MTNTLKYKGYIATVEYSAEDNVLFGKIAGINDLVTFESESTAGIESAFHDAVDDYIAYCKEVGKEPEKTYLGTFNVRINPELHRALAQLAVQNGTTLNQTVEQAISQYITHH